MPSPQRAGRAGKLFSLPREQRRKRPSPGLRTLRLSWPAPCPQRHLEQTASRVRSCANTRPGCLESDRCRSSEDALPVYHSTRRGPWRSPAEHWSIGMAGVRLKRSRTSTANALGSGTEALTITVVPLAFHLSTVSRLLPARGFCPTRTNTAGARSGKARLRHRLER